jgi:hypothetical protein
LGLADVGIRSESQCELNSNDKWVPKGSTPGSGYCISAPQTSLLSQAWNATGGQVVHYAATHTVGLCVNGEAAGGIWREVSLCAALVGGHVTFIGTLAGGGGSPNSSGSVGLLVSNARTPQELQKAFATFGGSITGEVVSVGDDFSVGLDSCNNTIWENQFEVGTPMGIPFEFHGGASYTWTFTP